MEVVHQQVQDDPEQSRRVAILGFGQEGKAVLEFLKRTEPQVKPVVLDKKRDPKYLSKLQNFDIIYRSPGVPYNLPQIQQAIKRGVKFSSATDLFFQSASRRTKGTIIGITGTKGKSTTSTLLYQALRNAGRDVYLGGNVGKPAIELLPKLKKSSITILELSSFQLQDLKHSPHIAVILDVFPDHLDAHQSFEEYIRAKSQITRYQTPKDIVFYFSDSKRSTKVAGKSRGKKIPVSSYRLIRTNKPIRILGEHNRRNAAMAAAVASYLKVPEKTIIATLKKFGGLPHRLKLVRTIKGVKFYNDSASTNPQTTVAAIKSFPNQPKILIMGGKDKGLDYKPIAEAVYSEDVKSVILFGENRKKIEKALRRKPRKSLAKLGARGTAKRKLVSDLNSVVKIAFEAAKFGDVIIFSPGAASFDMFESYKARGKEFERVVRHLK